jgi:hypothetical protein
MENKIKTLLGESCDEIVLISENNPYKNGQRAKDKKSFNLYRYEGLAFTVESTNHFCNDYANGKLASVKLIETTREVEVTDDEGVVTKQQVPALEFDCHKSKTQEINRAKHTLAMNSLKAMESQPVTEDFLKLLIEA